jgi:hypothetical protein
MSEEVGGGWRRCSSCKKAISFGAPYWACNVSTCNRPRTGLVFCTVSCWDAHLSVVNHRESWAVERTAPSRGQWQREQAAEASGGAVSRPAASAAPRRILASGPPKPPDPTEHDILIVLSKLKAYVRARSGFNTSDQVAGPLSDAVRNLSDRAIEKARAEGRKTILERDFD